MSFRKGKLKIYACSHCGNMNLPGIIKHQCEGDVLDKSQIAVSGYTLDQALDAMKSTKSKEKADVLHKENSTSHDLNQFNAG